MDQESKKEMQEFKKLGRVTPFALWTIETLTALLAMIALAGLVSGLIGEYEVGPKKQAQYVQLSTFQTGQLAAFDNRLLA